jgi:hypothetical protein
MLLKIIIILSIITLIVGIIIYFVEKKPKVDDPTKEKPKVKDSHAGSHHDSHSGNSMISNLVTVVIVGLIIWFVYDRCQGNTDSFTVELQDEHVFEMLPYQYANIRTEKEIILETPDGRVGYIDKLGNLKYSNTDKSTNRCGVGFWKLRTVPQIGTSTVSVDITDTRSAWNCFWGINKKG